MTHDDVSKQHGAKTTALDELRAAHTTLQEAHDKLQSEHSTSSARHTSLNEDLSRAKNEAESTAAKLDVATKRADAAEKKRQALQEENGELVKQLEEVRGRVVQVMEDKVDLAGRVESLEGKSKAWEREKEAQLEEMQVGQGSNWHIGCRCSCQSLRSQTEVLAEDHRTSSSRVEELQTELQSVKAEVQSKDEQLQEMQAKLDKAEEFAKAKEADETSEKPAANGDEISALRSAHALEISQQAEKVRSLETALHAAESRVHALSRQLTDLQAAQASMSLSSPGSRGLFLSDEGSSSYDRRNPMGNARPTGVDALLPAHVRHKRQVSLSALKARMEPSISHRLAGMPLGNVPEDGDSRRASMSSTGTPGVEGKGAVAKRNGARLQFGEEIVFCCPACEGDLIEL
jgi:hypothetical protein